MPNRLAGEASPYLLQHKDNPVDWYPWGDEALERARSEDKPILLSIGYAACHWCHVMERESFEDARTALLMNENFVSVKVDREERPDLDAIYMEAVQTMTGHGGWPMTVFLTPEGVPFFGGTYFPPTDRHGMPSFTRLLEAVADAWRTRRDDIEKQGRELIDHIGVAARVQPSDEDISASILEQAFAGLKRSFDPEYGGFGSAPKFPQPMTVDFLLRMAKRGASGANEMVLTTLDAMAAGGMFDQLGGGFARYSVDRAWVVPHFEKMLYDNAQLLRTYARAHLQHGRPRHREVAEATAAWMLTEMRDPGGGFYSSLDADSEGEEGRFYVWSIDEVRAAAGDDFEVAVAEWGFTDEGNFEGRNIPVYAHRAGDEDAVERARAKLLEARGRRVRPGTDDKILTAWNALASAALAEAGRALEHPEWVAAAVEAMDFVFDHLTSGDRLLRSFRRGPDGATVVKHLGCCDDYAFSLEAALALFEATHDGRWLDRARRIADEAIGLFWDDAAGGFFTTGADAEELVVRPKDLFDNAVPAANSAMALELQRLALLTTERKYEDRALATMRLVTDLVERSPLGFGHMLGAFDFYADDPVEIVIVGDPESDARSLIETVDRRYLPNVVVVADADGGSRTPLLEGRSRVNGAAAAYVCRRGVCRRPVTTPEDLLGELAA